MDAATQAPLGGASANSGAEGTELTLRALIERYMAEYTGRDSTRGYRVAWWIERDGASWLVRRPDKGMLGGMRALPGGDWSDEPPPESGIVRVDHGFTHFDLRLSLVRRDAPPEASAEAPDAAAEGIWWPIAELDAAGLPTLYRKLTDKMLERDA